MIKENNEITVKITCPLYALYDFLYEHNYQMTNHFTMVDKYLIPKNTDLINKTSREILSKAIIIRDIFRNMNNSVTKKITFKNKEFDESGNIVSQNSVNCPITDIDSAVSIFKCIGYYEVMEITEDDEVFEKDGFSFAIKDIINGDKLIEIETSEKYDTIDKLIAKLKDLHLPVDYSNYFVKKAEIELDKIKN